MVLITHPHVSLGAGAFEVGRAKEKGRWYQSQPFEWPLTQVLQYWRKQWNTNQPPSYYIITWLRVGGGELKWKKTKSKYNNKHKELQQVLMLSSHHRASWKGNFWPVSSLKFSFAKTSFTPNDSRFMHINSPGWSKMTKKLTSMLSSEFMPATRPRYQEPSSYSAQHACEKKNNENPKRDSIIFSTHLTHLKRCQATRKKKKILECRWPRKTKVSLLCCFRLKNMVHFPLTSATCTAYANNSETHLTNRNKPIRHPVCWTFSAGIELPTKIYIQVDFQKKVDNHSDDTDFEVQV